MVATATRCEPDIATARVARLTAADGVELAVESRGEATSQALLFAHGFGQTRGAWSVAAAELAAQGWRCISADARGHGASGWRADGAYEFTQFIDDLVRLARWATATDGARPILVGASMGGLLGIMAQALHEPFRALILVDITPRWESAGIERIIAFMRAHPQGFASLEDAAAAIAAYLPQRRERYQNGRARAERLRELLVPLDNGRLRWHWDPRLLERIAADGERQQAALLDAARRIRIPTLLISGADSDVVSQATIDEFIGCVPHARHVRLADATHMVAGDRNDVFTAAVREFVETVGTDVRCET
jgi:pimeloyl-ACP methyl ester carboxylesterase